MYFKRAMKKVHLNGIIIIRVFIFFNNFFLLFNLYSTVDYNYGLS